MEHEIAIAVGRDPILGLFGAKNFPDLTTGRSLSERRQMIKRFKRLITILRPKLVYIVPVKGINRAILPILKLLEVPYIVVNPYKGFFDKVEDGDKLQLLIGIENSKSVVTISTPPKNEKEAYQIVEESKEFIIDRADLVISIYGSNQTRETKKLNKELESIDAHVAFLDYSLI